MLILILKSCWLLLDSIFELKIKLIFIKLKIEHHENLVGSIYQENYTQVGQWDSIWFQFPTLMHSLKRNKIKI
jgi:hypothetical protein